MLTEEQKEKVMRAMEPHMALDEYGRSCIRNIYFDTDNYRLIRHSIEKTTYKEKLRIRSYMQATEDSTVFVELKNKVNPIICANLLTGDILSYLNKTYKNINDIDKNSIIDLVNVLDQNKISIKQAKEIMDDVLDGNESVSEIIKNKGLEQISDLSQLKEIVTKVLNENEKSVNDYLSGQDRAFKYLMGQIMKETKGNANPSLVNQMLTQELNDKKN